MIPPSKPPTLIGLKDAAAYAARRFGIAITRQTVYNWIKIGANHRQLKSIRRGHRLYTTNGWVDEFLAN